MNRFHSSIRFCLDLIYPNRCPCCEEFLPWNEYLCRKCREKVFFCPDEVLCRRCGKIKSECMCAVPLEYDEAAAVSYYDNGARNGLLLLKDASNRNFGWYAGVRLGEWILRQPDWMKADGLVPVPMSTGKKLLRGYNQAEVIAKGISSVTKIPVRKDCLIKKHGSREQHTLGLRERAMNVEKFQPAGRDLEGLRLILCDDILTTGATMSRCAEILKACGAEMVYAAAAATVYRKKEG
ncbi:MAG: ComF family protein [Ruminococcus sp.]|nr:ComF family protein [Ruminococcus sp.]